MKAKTEEKNHALDNAKGWMDTITEHIDALEMDWDRYEELKEMDAKDMSEEELEEFAELRKTAGEYESAEDVRERINESPLEVVVRSDWYAPGSEQDKPSEYKILLSTGGPALRIIGDLDQYGQPETARLEYQDWFTPWEEYTEADEEYLLKWASNFYFGD